MNIVWLGLLLLLTFTIPIRAQSDHPKEDLRQEIESLKKRITELEKTASGLGKGSSPAPTSDEKVPFAFADFTWLNGNDRTHSSPMETKYFTGELRVGGNTGTPGTLVPGFAPDLRKVENRMTLALLVKI